MVQVTRPNSIEEQRRVASLSKKIGRIVTASDFERIAGSRVTAAASEAAFGHIASPDPLGNGGQADLMLLLRRMNKAIKKSLPLVAHGNSAFPIRDTGYRPDDGTENEHQGEHTERFLAHIENNHGAEAADEYRQSIQRGEVLTVANKYKEKTVQPGTRASEDADSDDCEHPGGDIDGFIHPEYRARGWDPDTKEFQGELAGLGVRDYYSEMYSRVYPKEIADQIVQGLFGDPTEENTRRPDMTTIRSERGRTQKEDRPYSDDEWAGIGDRQAPPKGRRLYGDEDRDVNTDDRRGEQRPVGDPDPEPVSSVPSAENPAPRVDPDLVKIDDVSPFRAFIKKARQYLKTKGDITPGKQAHALSRALLRGEISTKALSLIKQQATKEAISKNVRSQINQNEDPLEGMNKRTLGKYYRMAIQRIFSAAKKQAGSKKRVQRQEQSERTKTYMRTPSGPDRRAAIGQGDEGVDIGVGTGKPQAPDAEDNVEDEMEEEGGKYFIPGPDPDSGQRINVTSYVDENGNWIAGKPRPTRTENGGWIFKSLVKRLESALRKAAPEDPTSAVSTVVANERLNSGNKSIDDPKQAILNAVTQRTQANLTANGAQNKALTDPSGQAAWKTGFWRSGEKIYPHVASIQYADPERKDPYLSYDRNTDAWEGKLTRIHSGILHPAVVAGKVGYGLARAFASGLTGIDPHDIVSFAGDAVKDTTAVAQDTIGLLDRSKDWLKNTIGPKLGFKSKGGAADTTTTLPGGSGPNPLAGAYGLGFDASDAQHNIRNMPLDQIKISHPEVHEAIIAQHPNTKVAYDAWVANPTAETRAALDASIHSLHREDRKTNILATMTPDQKGYIVTGKFEEVAKTPDGAKTIDKVLRHLMHDEIGASSLTPDDENSLKAAFLDPATNQVGTILKDWAGLGAANDHEDVASRLRNALMKAHNTMREPGSRQALAKLLGMTPEQSDQSRTKAISERSRRREEVRRMAMEHPDLMADMLRNMYQIGEDIVLDPITRRNPASGPSRRLTPEQRNDISKQALKNPEAAARVLERMLKDEESMPINPRDPKAKEERARKINFLSGFTADAETEEGKDRLADLVSVLTGHLRADDDQPPNTGGASGVQAEQPLTKLETIKRIDGLIEETQQQLAAAGGTRPEVTRPLQYRLDNLRQRRSDTIANFKEQPTNLNGVLPAAGRPPVPEKAKTSEEVTQATIDTLDSPISEKLKVAQDALEVAREAMRANRTMDTMSKFAFAKEAVDKLLSQQSEEAVSPTATSEPPTTTGEPPTTTGEPPTTTGEPPTTTGEPSLDGMKEIQEQLDALGPILTAAHKTKSEALKNWQAALDALKNAPSDATKEAEKRMNSIFNEAERALKSADDKYSEALERKTSVLRSSRGAASSTPSAETEPLSWSPIDLDDESSPDTGERGDGATSVLTSEGLKDSHPDLHAALAEHYGTKAEGATADSYLNDHAEKEAAGSSSHISELMNAMKKRGTPINEWQAADILAHYSRKPDAPGEPAVAPGEPAVAPGGSAVAPGGSAVAPGGSDGGSSSPFKWETHRDKSVQDFLNGIPDGDTTSAREFFKENPDAAHAIGLKSSLSEIHNDFYKLSDEINNSDLIKKVDTKQDEIYVRRLIRLAATLKSTASYGESETRLPEFKSIHDITTGSSSNVSPAPMGRMLDKLLTGVTQIMSDSLEQAKSPVSDEQQKFRQDIFDKLKRTLAKQGVTINIPEIGQQFNMRDLDKSFTVGVPDGETLDKSQPVYVVSVSKPSVKHAVDQRHLTWKGAEDTMPPQYTGQMIVSNTPPTDSVIKDSLDSLRPPPDAEADPSTPDAEADLSGMSPDDLAAADLSRMSIDQLENYRNAIQNAQKKLNDDIFASGGSRFVSGAGTAEQQGMLTRLEEADLNAKKALKDHPDRTSPLATVADIVKFKEKVKRDRELAATKPNATTAEAPEASNVTERVLGDMEERPSSEMNTFANRAAGALRPVDDRNSVEHDNAIYGSLQSDEQLRRLAAVLGPPPFQRPSPSEDEVATLRRRANFSASLSRRIPRKFSKSSPSNDPKRLIMSIYNSL